MIPESNNAKTSGLKVCGSRLVAFDFIAMLTAVNLHHQCRVEANEIDNRWPNRELPTKLETAEAPATQLSPESAFGVG